jgi:hypothetical protein
MLRTFRTVAHIRTIRTVARIRTIIATGTTGAHGDRYLLGRGFAAPLWRSNAR